MKDHPAPSPQDITIDEALQRSLSRADIVAGTESLPLNEASGRILRDNVKARINVPQQDTAAVDGYAFHAADVASAQTPLEVMGSIKAGHPYGQDAPPGFAYRIFTGAPMPKGPDTVAMEEHCQIGDDGRVIMPDGIKKGANFRPMGENVKLGEVVLTSGTRMGPSEIGLAASIGMDHLTVASPLRIATLSTGDEVVEAGSSEGFNEGRLHDSNRPMLASLLTGDGHRILDRGIIRDDRQALTRCFEQALDEADAIISTGGSSTGEEDHARPAIEAAGGNVDFWRLAIKPGRPMAVGWINGKPVFCLPGNPVASFVCYRLMVLPILTAMQGGINLPVLKLPLASGFSHRHRGDRTEYLRARVDLNTDGEQAIFIHGRAGAGVLSSLTGADGLVEIPADHGHVNEGDRLNFIPFRERGL